MAPYMHCLRAAQRCSCQMFSSISNCKRYEKSLNMHVQGFPPNAQCSSHFLLHTAFKAPEGLNDHVSLKKETNSSQSLLSFPLSAATLNSSSLLQRMLFPAEHLLEGLQPFQSRQFSANTTVLSFLFLYMFVVSIYVCICTYRYT